MPVFSMCIIKKNITINRTYMSLKTRFYPGKSVQSAKFYYLQINDSSTKYFRLVRYDLNDVSENPYTSIDSDILFRRFHGHYEKLNSNP